MAQSLYRKYRPQTFDDVVGQEHIERTLRNAVASGNVSHAYLFCGPRGTGKTTTARLLAKALLCNDAPTPDPCGACEACLEIAEGLHPDVYELDAASRTGVDNVREEIISRVQFAPTQGSFKVYIIDEVHMLSVPAFNALLKTLEEPPAHIVFILCTTDPQKVPATILSRCQRFDFHRLTTEELVGNLERICKAEGFTPQREALELIAVQAQGGMRDAITSLEQAAVFGGGTVTEDIVRDMIGGVGDSQLFQLADIIAARDMATALQWLDTYVSAGSDIAQLARDLAFHFRDLFVVKLTGGEDGLVVADAAQLALLQKQASLFTGTDRLSRIVEVLAALVSELRSAPNARLSFEIALMKVMRPDTDLTLEALAERVEALEDGGLARSFSQPHTYVVANTLGVQGQAQEAPAPSCPVDFPDAPVDVLPAGDADAQQPAQAHAVTQGTSAPVEEIREPYSPDPAETAAILADKAAVQRLWNAVTKEAKQRSRKLTSIFGDTHAYGSPEGVLVVEFPKDATFALRTCSDPETKKMLSEIVATMFGQPLELRLELAGQGGETEQAASEPTTQQTTPQAAPEPAAQQAVQEPAAQPAVQEPSPSQEEPEDEYVFEDVQEEDEGPEPMQAGAAQIAEMLGVFGAGVTVVEED